MDLFKGYLCICICVNIYSVYYPHLPHDHVSVASVDGITFYIFLGYTLCDTHGDGEPAGRLIAEEEEKEEEEKEEEKE